MILRLEDCACMFLFNKIQAYLFINNLENGTKLAKSTKKFEMLKYFEIYGPFFQNDNGITQVVRKMIGNRQIDNKQNTIKYVMNVDKIIKIHNIINNNLLIVCKSKRGNINYCIDDIFRFTGIKSLEELYKFADVNNIPISYKNIRLEVALEKNRWIGLSKDKINKKMKNLNYEIELNTNNCLLFSLRSLFPCFNNEKFLKSFKILEICEQIKLINKILIENNFRKIERKNIVFGNIKEVVKLCIKKTILVFFDDPCDKGNFMNELQPAIIKMMEKELTIHIYSNENYEFNYENLELVE